AQRLGAGRPARQRLGVVRRQPRPVSFPGSGRPPGPGGGRIAHTPGRLRVLPGAGLPFRPAQLGPAEPALRRRGLPRLPRRTLTPNPRREVSVRYPIESSRRGFTLLEGG